MKSLTRIMLIAALTVLPMMAAAPSQAAKKMEVAVQDDGVFLYQEHYNREVAFQQLRNMGATHLRMNILWWQPIPEAQRNSTDEAARTSPTTGASGITRLLARRRTGSRCSSTSPAIRRVSPVATRRSRTSATATSRTSSSGRQFVRAAVCALQGQGVALLDVERAELVHVDQPAQAVADPLPQSLQGGLQGGQGGQPATPKSSWANWRLISRGASRCRRSSSSARWCA